MNANEVMKNSIEQMVNEIVAKSGAIYDGYRETAMEMAKLVESQESTQFLSFTNEQAFVAYNHAEDLKEEDAEDDKIQYALGVYDAYENFRGRFNKWLVKQDDITILKHSVNEEISIRDGVKLPPMDTMEQRLAFAMTQLYLRGYEQNENGDITAVIVEVGSQKRTFTYSEFSKLFEIDHMDYLK